MPNQHLVSRLAEVQKHLLAAFHGETPLGAAGKGRARESFVEGFLRQALPPGFRIGTGEITDLVGERSGPVDAVLELPLLPSVPPSHSPSGGARIYLAEGVAAVLEIKPDLSVQWDEVERSARAVKALERRLAATTTDADEDEETAEEPGAQIPVFAVGYRGFDSTDALLERVGGGVVDGILVLEGGAFASSDRFFGVTTAGPQGLWALICCLHQAATALMATRSVPINYLL